ncbi:MAG TPA: DnaJ C-terminal domain-containing protein [Rhodothermales bacterium]|nr:DnaJ C-terminal domain-containing protein [Rhodothermales bacterium]
MHGLSDYYILLEVGHAAGPEEIKRAFRRLARRYHPDRNNGDPQAVAQFHAVREAYQILSNPDRRSFYDRALGRAPTQGRNGAPTHENTTASSNLDGQSFADLFARAGTGQGPTGSPSPPFGGGVAMPRRGLDVEAQASLTFEEALVGGKTGVRLPGGRELAVPIPRGVRHGTKIRFTGRGGAAPAGGEAGDLYVTFRVEPSEHFRREGDDLHVVETVSALEAMLGAMRCIPNAYGQQVKLPVPPGTQPGDRLRLRGQGVETQEQTGDLYVEVQVAVPRDLTPEQRDALTACARRHGLL